jgi:dihydropteroate synthase
MISPPAVGPAGAGPASGPTDPASQAVQPLRLRAGEHELQLGPRPLLMGIVNASADFFSDSGRHPTLDAQLELARELLAAGADMLDIGGESATTGREPVPAVRELELVLPLVERVAGELGAIVSVGTHEASLARAAIAAGASIINDASGPGDPAVAEVCAHTGAALVVMHTRAAQDERRQDPDRDERRQDPDLYGDITGEVLAFLRERMATAVRLGVAPKQLIVDPGPDFAKTPAQTVRLLADVGRLHELHRPLLMAISRKDFIGALTQRAPRERLAGTLAALAHGADAGAHIFRVHDVAAAADFLTVRAALSGNAPPRSDLTLPEALRFDPGA